MSAALLLPSKLNNIAPFTEENNAFFKHRTRRRVKRNQSIFPVSFYVIYLFHFGIC